LVGRPTRLARFDPRDVASGLVPDDAAFVRHRVGRYIGPGGRPGYLTCSANFNKIAGVTLRD
jgi:hypothetical protein